MLKKLSLWFIFCISSFTHVNSCFALNLDTLLPDERNTVEIFQKAAPKVVYVHRLTTVLNRHLQKMQIPNGTGSGVIWDDKGHIVTNYHVIKGADKLSITLGNMTVPAKVIGVEPRKDIAVLEIQSAQAIASLKSYKPFDIVHLNDLVVGQKAIAIGNPYGLDHSLSLGVISALGRPVPGIGGVTINNMIQTDTPINPGNSGGPLLNSAGQLIGLNTMIYSKTGSSAGIGFAVPAGDVEQIVKQILTHGRVVLSGLGIARVQPDIARKLGVRRGILIGEVLPNTPAAQLHLRGTHKDTWGRVILGDVIVALNAHPIANYDVLYNLLTHIKVGQEVTVSIQRGNKQIDVKMHTIDVAAL